MKKLDAVQVEQLKQIGEYLYKEREQRSVPLEEVAVKTFIPLRLLQALELGQVERLPESIFVQGFIRRYADILGLDGMALAKTFDVESSAVAVKAAEPESEGVGQRVPEPIPLPKPSYSGPAGEARSLPSYGLISLLGGLAILLLGVGAWAIFQKPNQPVATPGPATNASPAAQRSATQPAGQPKSTPQPASPAAVAPKPVSADAPVQATIELKDDSWMQVIVDGKTEYEGILKKGDKKAWTAKKSLVLQSGNAGAVMVSYNQGEAKPIGAVGEVKDLTLPPEPEKPAN